MEAGTVSAIYTTEAGITSANMPPTTALDAASTARFGASAAIRPGTATPTRVKRISLTRPSLSESTPHTGCIRP
jgi:hypothetical protein